MGEPVEVALTLDAVEYLDAMPDRGCGTTPADPGEVWVRMTGTLRSDYAEVSLFQIPNYAYWQAADGLRVDSYLDSNCGDDADLTDTVGRGQYIEGDLWAQVPETPGSLIIGVGQGTVDIPLDPPSMD